MLSLWNLVATNHEFLFIGVMSLASFKHLHTYRLPNYLLTIYQFPN
jgi:hypothetical protein